MRGCVRFEFDTGRVSQADVKPKLFKEKMGASRKRSFMHQKPISTSPTRLIMQLIKPSFCLQKLLCSWPAAKIMLLLLQHAEVHVVHAGDERAEEHDKEQHCVLAKWSRKIRTSDFIFCSMMLSCAMKR